MRVSRCGINPRYAMRNQSLIRDERPALNLHLVSRIWTFFVSRISFRDRGAFYAVALAQRAASRSVNSPVMRLTTSAAPDSTSEASRPEISTCASMGTTDEPGGD